MSNDLVHVQSALPENFDTPSGDDEWDPVPTRERPNKGQSGDPHPRIADARKATGDAAKARARGDDGFAEMRDTDAEDDTQNRWDPGDLKTWLIIAAMFFGFLLVTAWVYWMPEGRHSVPPTIRVY